jgi:16S rRNA (cytidine1402-2'-O)-methyltransferase
VPVPGPSAAVTALSVYPYDHFVFYGFLPAKASERLRVLHTLQDSAYPVVFYEAPHRIVPAFADLITVFGSDAQAVLFKELTKVYETAMKDRLVNLLAWLNDSVHHRKGEFVIIVEPPGRNKDESAAERALDLLVPHLPLKQAASIAAALSGASKNRLYQKALQWQKKCE